MINVFRLEGEYWTIAYDDTIVRLRDRRGLQLLAHLLVRPGIAISATDLVQTGRRDPAPPCEDTMTDSDARERARITVTKSIKTALRVIRTVHAPLATHLDATIRCGYRCRYGPDPRVPIAWER